LTVALVGRFLMLVYALHVVSTSLFPIVAGMAAVGPVIVAAVAIGIAIVMRVAAGTSRTLGTTFPAAGRGWRRMVGLAALAAVVLLLQSPPVLPLRQIGAASPAAGATAGAAALGADKAVYVDSGGTAVNVTAVDLTTGAVAWKQSLATAMETTGARVTVLNGLAIVQALGASPGVTALRMTDGAQRWAKPDLVAYPFRDIIVATDPQGGHLSGLAADGSVRWTAAAAAGAVLAFPIADPAAPIAANRVDPAGGDSILGQFAVADPDGTVRVLRSSNGTQALRRPGALAEGGTLSMTARHVFVTTAGPAYHVTAIPIASGQAPWSYAAPSGADHASAVTPCGEERVCVADSLGTRAFDEKTGKAAFQRPGEAKVAYAGPDGTVVVWTGRGSELLGPDGSVVGEFSGERAYPLGPGELLLISEGTGGRTLAVFHTAGRWRERLGRAAMPAGACDWSRQTLACAEPGARLWALLDPATARGYGYAAG
jgi:outer membrane protein assembly factor BamB